MLPFDVTCVIDTLSDVAVLEVALESILALGAASVELAGRRILAEMPGVRSTRRLRADVERALEASGVAPSRLRIARTRSPRAARHWERRFGPERVGELVVVPAGADLASGGTCIRIDPGMAFGTGAHASTRLCLEWLERHAPLRSAPALLDVGTGTGVLAIAALRLGALRAVATEIDPHARDVARRNAELNGVASRMSVTGAAPGERFPLVLANLAGPVLSAQLPAIAAAIAPGGEGVLAGLTLEEESSIAEACAALGVEVRARAELEGSVRLVVRQAGSKRLLASTGDRGPTCQ